MTVLFVSGRTALAALLERRWQCRPGCPSGPSEAAVGVSRAWPSAGQAMFRETGGHRLAARARGLAREAALGKRLQAVPAKPGVGCHLPGFGGKIRPREGLNTSRKLLQVSGRDPRQKPYPGSTQGLGLGGQDPEERAVL